MKTIPAGEFKQHCLRLMDVVRRKRQPIVITKRGRPIAKLVPIEEDVATDVLGILSDSIEITGDIIAPIAPSGAWDAMSDKAAKDRRDPR